MDYGSNLFGNPAFLRALIIDGNVTLTHKMLDWKYGNRREAQKILPFLYVGPFSAAKDEKDVRETAFTFLLSVRSTASGPTRTMDAVKMAAQSGFQSAYNLDVDSPTDLVRKFPAAIKAINDHLENSMNGIALDLHHIIKSESIRGKVLVSCETGNERSAAFVAAYLMAVFNIDLITAIQTVQSQRFSMCMDDSIKNALGTFEMLLSARRDVGRANQLLDGGHQKENLRPQVDHESTLSARLKRPLDDVYDDDADMETLGWEPMQVQERRTGAAPFQDMEE